MAKKQKLKYNTYITKLYPNVYVCVSVFVLILYPLVPSTKDLPLIWKTRQLFDAFLLSTLRANFSRECLGCWGMCGGCGLCGLYVYCELCIVNVSLKLSHLYRCALNHSCWRCSTALWYPVWGRAKPHEWVVVWPLCHRWHTFSFLFIHYDSFDSSRHSRCSMLWPPLRFSISIVFVKFVYFWRPLGLRFCVGFSCLALSSLLISTLRKQVSCAQHVVDCSTDTLHVCVSVCICRYAQLSPYPTIQNIEINIGRLSTGY